MERLQKQQKLKGPATVITTTLHVSKELIMVRGDTRANLYGATVTRTTVAHQAADKCDFSGNKHDE